MAAPAVAWPFSGLPTVWFVLFSVALLVIVAMFLWTVVLFARAQRARGRPPRAEPNGTDAFTWVFLVPALNEELTIRDSVARLLSVPVARKRVVVVDDGSDDGTAAVLAELAASDLTVLRREPPDARQGKAAALNYAYRALLELLADEDPDRVIVVVVDADGRLAPDAPRYAAAHFADPQVGGVQALVRIYNRNKLLTWLQDVEFSVYGFLFQAGRTASGTAGMGGNGQFNRLSALRDVADETGPWRDKLTEDQDLGLRLIEAGWEGRQELRAVVDQQGPPGLRLLLRQRTRWSQGNLQAIQLTGAVARAPRSWLARADLVAYLLMPLWQSIVGISLIAAILLVAVGEVPLWDDESPWQLVFFYLLGFGGVIMGCVARGAPEGVLGMLRGVLVAQVYAFYTWLIWPVLARSLARQLTDRRGWAKTERVDPARTSGAES
jgi:cellulose synthase/poly-beta-1,6-N-acetylglucosamine synthase-like glycosyltransferase